MSKANSSREMNPSSPSNSATRDNIQPAPSIRSEDIILPTLPQDTPNPVPPKDTHSLYQSDDRLSSEVESYLEAGQPTPSTMSEDIILLTPPHVPRRYTRSPVLFDDISLSSDWESFSEASQKSTRRSKKVTLLPLVAL